MIKITNEQLISGCLLKYGSIDTLDLLLIKKEIRNKINVKFTSSKLSYITNLININDGVISLKDGYTYDSLILKALSLREFLKNISLPLTQCLLDDINIEDIRKQKEEIPKDYSLLDFFNQPETVQTFCQKYSKEINDFEIKIKQLNLDSHLLYSFLISRNFYLPIDEILNLDDYEEFCNSWDFNILSTCNKNRIHFIQANKFDSSLFEITHPNHALYLSKLNDLIPEIIINNSLCQNFDWNNLDISRMINSRNYTVVDQTNWKDAEPQLIMQITKEIIKNPTIYIALLESYPLNGIQYFIARAIYRYNQDGLAVAINPEYLTASPNKDNKVSSDIYLKRRKNSLTI